MVREYLRDEFGRDAIIPGWVTWCRNDVTGNMMPFDIILDDPLNIIVEVDGPQHFKEHKYFKSRTLPEIQAMDAMKEVRAIKKGYGLIRVKQEDVWHERIDWKQLLLDAIRSMNRENPCVKKLWEEK